MANPSLVTCTAGAWTKVLTAVTTGVVAITKNDIDYRSTWRDTGGAAPTLLTDGLYEVLQNLNDVESYKDIDVYVWAIGSVDGQVRIEP